MQTLTREWHRAVKRVVDAHMKLAQSVKATDRKFAQKECDSALAEYRIAYGKMLDRADPSRANRQLNYLSQSVSS
jgi:hypothetical protein